MRSIASTLFVLSALFAHKGFSQINDHKYKVLFLGNSYTYVNDLPSMTASAAMSAGDTLIHDNNNIGGYTLQQHSTNATSLAKLAAGNWDYVVLQEQSQKPSFPDGQVDVEVFPYARALDSLVHHYNSCGRSMFYMTWGRKNGDVDNCASWPPVCSYMGMDSLLRFRYMTTADSNNALLSPVGAVWRNLRANYPTLELYQTDESHPSVAGTYAAACCFYTTIFKRSPLLITFNSTLAPSDAANIRTAVKTVVFDSLSKWHIKQYSPTASGTYTITSGNLVTFTGSSTNATTTTWYFGDGSSSNTLNTTHTYSGGGSFTAKLVAVNCGKSDTAKLTINLPTNAVQNLASVEQVFKMLPNPAHDVLTLTSEAFLSATHEINVINSLGQVVHRAECNHTTDQHIDISRLSGGVYTVMIQQDGLNKYRAPFLKN